MKIILVKFNWKYAEYLPVLVLVAAGDGGSTELFAVIFLEWSFKIFYQVVE
jgi:hypothetical protein